MEIKDILREKAGNRTGYLPQKVSKTKLDPKDATFRGAWRPLAKVPSKITAYFHRDKIKEVYKSDHTRDPRDNYYIIRATDGTLFHVDY